MHQPQGHWGNQLLDAMPQPVADLLKHTVWPVILPQGFVCFEPGDPIQHVYWPTSGLISLVLTMKNGDLVEAGIIGHEGAAGLQCAMGHRVSFTRGIVQIAGSFYTVPAEPLRRAIATSDEAKALVNHYTEILLDEAHQLTACNALHPGKARLARWLLQSADRAGRERLPLTHEFLGDMLGMRRTSVTLFAEDLWERGAIRYSRGRITILNRRVLETCACECYRIMRELHRDAAIPERVSA